MAFAEPLTGIRVICNGLQVFAVGSTFRITKSITKIGRLLFVRLPDPDEHPLIDLLALSLSFV